MGVSPVPLSSTDWGLVVVVHSLGRQVTAGIRTWTPITMTGQPAHTGDSLNTLYLLPSYLLRVLYWFCHLYKLG